MIVIVDKHRLRAAILLLLLIIMVFCWWLLSKNDSGTSLVENNLPGGILPASSPSIDVESALPSSALDEYRLERDRARSAQEELLHSASQDKTLGEERRTQLAQELLRLMQKGEHELQAETLLAASGYDHAVVVITASGATVVLPLVVSKEEAARVGDMVSRVCGIKTEQVVIMDAVGQP